MSSLGRELYLFFSVFAEPVGGENCFFAASRITNDLHADDHSCGAGNFGGAAELGPLTDNGGRTLTREPLPGSPLIDTIPAGYGFPSLGGAAPGSNASIRPISGASCVLRTATARPGATTAQGEPDRDRGRL